jgi:hypothetical protein
MIVMAGHRPAKTGVNALMSRPSRLGGHPIIRRCLLLDAQQTLMLDPRFAAFDPSRTSWVGWI